MALLAHGISLLSPLSCDPCRPRNNKITLTLLKAVQAHSLNRNLLGLPTKPPVIDRRPCCAHVTEHNITVRTATLDARQTSYTSVFVDIS